MIEKDNIKNQNQFLKDFELEVSKYDEFWNSYEKKDIWLEKSIRISIAARNMSNEISILFQELMENQSVYDRAWKEFAAQKLLVDLRREWDIEQLDEKFVINALYVSAITFGFDKEPAAFCVWFNASNVEYEHAVQIYGDIQGKIIRASIE